MRSTRSPTIGAHERHLPVLCQPQPHRVTFADWLLTSSQATVARVARLSRRPEDPATRSALKTADGQAKKAGENLFEARPKLLFQDWPIRQVARPRRHHRHPARSGVLDTMPFWNALLPPLGSPSASPVHPARHVRRGLPQVASDTICFPRSWCSPSTNSHAPASTRVFMPIITVPSEHRIHQHIHVRRGEGAIPWWWLRRSRKALGHPSTARCSTGTPPRTAIASSWITWRARSASPPIRPYMPSDRQTKPSAQSAADRSRRAPSIAQRQGLRHH